MALIAPAKLPDPQEGPRQVTARRILLWVPQFQFLASGAHLRSTLPLCCLTSDSPGVALPRLGSPVPKALGLVSPHSVVLKPVLCLQGEQGEDGKAEGPPGPPGDRVSTLACPLLEREEGRLGTSRVVVGCPLHQGVPILLSLSSRALWVTEETAGSLGTLDTL